jgi:hypothetical protein
MITRDRESTSPRRRGDAEKNKAKLTTDLHGQTLIGTQINRVIAVIGGSGDQISEFHDEDTVDKTRWQSYKVRFFLKEIPCIAPVVFW